MKKGLALPQNGNVIPLVLVAIAVVSIASMTIIDLVVFSRQQIALQKNIVNYKSAMDSIIDYTEYAIKNRWCMNANWTRDLTCDPLQSPMSFERLIMADQTVRTIDDYEATSGTSSYPVPRRVGSIETVLSLSSISSAHPIYRTLQAILHNTAIDQIYIRAQRVNLTTNPVYGEESQVEIHVELRSSFTTVFRDLTSISADATILVFPREVSTFALVVPRDLRLDSGSPISGVGDANIPLNSAAPGSIGLRFESPVFVNRNIVLPLKGSGYSPAKFIARPVIGRGAVIQNSAPLVPATLGDEADRFFDNINELGGMLAGVEIDNAFDTGLDYLVGTTPPPSASMLTKCVDYGTRKFDLQKTRNGRTLIQSSSLPTTGSPVVGARIGLSHGGLLLAQRYMGYAREINPAPLAPFSIAPGTNPSVDPPVTGVSPIARVILLPRPGGSIPYNAAGFISKASLPFNATMTTRFTGGSRIAVSILPVPGTSGLPQANQFDVKIESTGTIPGPLDVYVIPYDVAFNGGWDRRMTNPGIETEVLDVIPTPDPKRHARLTVTPTGPNLTLSASTSIGGSWLPLTPPNPAGGANALTAATQPDPSVDTGQEIAFCEDERSGAAQALPSTNPGAANFETSTRVSWNFANPTDNPIRYLRTSAPGANNDVVTFGAASQSRFNVFSIVRHCIIDSTTDFFAGFLTCDIFEIRPRSSPLTIVGTVIASQTIIHASAISRGIYWRSIYHPQSIVDLRARRVLRPFDPGATCEAVPSLPIWSGVLSLRNRVSQQQCNPIWLRQMAGPFSWTQVNPDCGLDSTGLMSCKRRPERFLINEITRRWNL